MTVVQGNNLASKVIIFTKKFGIIPAGTVGYCQAIENNIAYVWVQYPILNMHNFNFKVEELAKYVRVR